MLFISRDRRASKRETLLYLILPTAVIFLSFLIGSIISWQITIQRVNEERDRLIEQNIQAIESKAQGTLNDYRKVLKAGLGLFGASEDVTRQEWRDFQKTLNIEETFPGLPGIAYAPRVPLNQLNRHEESVRQEGYTKYSVKPQGERSSYVPILYTVNPIKPGKEDQAPGFGYDISTDETRANTLEIAVKKRDAALSPKLYLIQGTNSSRQPASIIYMPIFNSNGGNVGFIYAPFVVKDVFSQMAGGISSEFFGYRIYDQSVEESNLMFENKRYSELVSAEERGVIRFDVLGRTWVLDYRVDKNIIDTPAYRDPNNALVGGVLFSALLAGLVFTLLRYRAKSLSINEERQLQQAKDDLLSIASHQLRTPATGVKQYIGMLKQGYAGSLTPNQKNIINQAYDSNERQLSIIDDILHVARIDSGRIELNHERLRARELINEIVGDRNNEFKEKSQKIFTTYPQRSSFVWADKGYLRMALDNIITNAGKYTPERGKIHISIKSLRRHTKITISDTGVGIAEKDIEQIFNKFSRLPNELSRKSAGTGLGLYIAKEIIELHKGTISIESKENVGTTFTIILPKSKQVAESEI